MFEDVSNSVISSLIDEWIKHSRNRDILKDRLINGMCFEPLADKYNMSVRQTKNIVYKGERILLKHIK